MVRYKITVEYDGTNMVGWQRQKNPNSVQQFLEEAIYQFSKEEITIYGCGRTDAGVHAYAHISHFDLVKNYDTLTIIKAINFYLRPSKIAVINAEIVDDNFHARFEAKARSYKYLIINRRAPLILDKNRAWHIIEPINEKLMQKASKSLIGKHDFTSFRAKSCQAKSAYKTLEQLKIVRDNEQITFFLQAPSFLHHMIRNIVGTLVNVGSGKIESREVAKILTLRDRKAAGPTAPACGLYFLTAYY